jgi:hypothetical protein
VAKDEDIPKVYRVPWPPGFPPVHAHARWEVEGYVGAILPDHPQYWPAKKRRIAQAALKVCEDVIREAVLESLFDLCFQEPGEPPPIVVAPAAAPYESQNALATAYGAWLANEMGWQFDRAILNAKTVSRDFSTDGWFRLVCQPAFYGTVQSGRRYVIADDVCTTGGTIASLRGFIEVNGGRVVAATALASKFGEPVPISLEPSTRSSLTFAFAGGLDAICQEELVARHRGFDSLGLA